MLSTLLQLLSLLVLNFCYGIECDWRHEFLCGDTCLEPSHLCYCGHETLTYSDTRYVSCCNDLPCRKDSNENVVCQGTAQSSSMVCNGVCQQDGEHGWTTLPCNSSDQCYLKVYSCLGRPLCDDYSDLLHCSEPNEEHLCEENEFYKECNQMPNAAFENYACTDKTSETFHYFDCPNRMEKARILFQDPPVPTKGNGGATNYNQFLDFDENFIFCGKRNISYSKFHDVKDEFPGELCALKDGGTVYLIDLWADLLWDYSFKMSERFDDFYDWYRKDDLKRTCEAASTPFTCNDKLNWCTYDFNVCDGVANCPNGEDEAYELCIDKGRFSPLATVECTANHIFNVNITIKAVRCDNVVECKSGEDESFCSIPEYPSVVALIVIFMTNSVLIFFLWKYVSSQLEVSDPPSFISQDQLRSLHQTSILNTLMHDAQKSERSKLINTSYIKREIRCHDGQSNEILCCVKNSLDPYTAAKVLNDCPLVYEPESLIRRLMKKWKNSSFYKDHRIQKILTLKIIVASTSHLLDLTKDALILVEVAFSQGGFVLLMAQPKPYIKGIFFSLLGSIVIPFILCSIRILSKGPTVLLGRKGLLYWILMVVFIPFYPMLLFTSEALLEYANKTYKISANFMTNLKFHTSQFIQADLGLESHLQIVISLVLLLLAHSDTRTILGLEVLFDGEIFLYLPTKFALAISILWSLYSCITSHLKGVTKKREYSNNRSFLIMLVYTSISIVIRVLSYILYLTPPLGLFHTLRHLQGEMYPFYNPYYQHVNVTEDLFYFGDAPPIPWSKITRWNYTDYKEAEPPSQRLYTVFSIGEYFWIMFAILGLNILSQILAIRFTNPEVYKKLSLIDVLIHGICNCFIPHPMEEWDEKEGSVEMHRLRKHLVLKEMIASILLNFVFNLILLTPLIILGINVFDRHAILVNSIGAFPEEIEAFERLKLMLILSFTLLLLSTIIQILSFYLCNGKFHPFTLIAQDDFKLDEANLAHLNYATDC